MTTSRPYQNQMKYQLTASDYRALRSRLNGTAAEGGDAGRIHTLRFASYRPRLASGQDQTPPATPQFALSYYNSDPTYLFLERQMECAYDCAMVTEAECRALLAGQTDWLLARHNPVLRDFYGAITEQMLLPHVLLSYHRETYSLDDLELWVALDTDLRTTLQHMDFLDPDLLARDTAGQEGMRLLQISYSTTIPDHILCVLEEAAPHRKLLSGNALPAFAGSGYVL